MKFAAIVSVGITAALLAGCQSKPKAAVQAQPDPLTPSYVEAPITDIAPMPPETVQPAMTLTPVAYDPASVTSTPMGSGSYTVQRGDTLYGIARRTYGDGKQWQKIAAANPGVSPQALKVGQKLQLPQ